MYDSLKRNGLSDTKHSLKFHTGNCSAVRSPLSQHQSRKKQNKIEPVQISHFNADSHRPGPQGEVTILDLLIRVIATSESQSCLHKGHDRNPKRFICLEPSCSAHQDRIGCSYCFLEGHRGHARIESKRALADLVDIGEVVGQSRTRIKQSLLSQKRATMNRISESLREIRETFNQGLTYLQKKISESIEQQFTQNISRLNSISFSSVDAFQVDSQNWTYPDSCQQSLKSMSKAASGDRVISDVFELFDSSQKQRESTMKCKSNCYQTVQHDKTKKNQKPTVNLSKGAREFLLEKLTRLNRGQLDQHLRQETLDMGEMEGYLRVYEEFYRELSTALEEFFTTFKCTVPGFRSFQRCLDIPEILRKFDPPFMI